jgi:ribonuclease HII
MRIEPDTFFESKFWNSGWPYVAGLDEAGRGALAGPVAVGAVILPNHKRLLSRSLAGVRDSKQMTPFEREWLVPRIKEVALAWGVGFASADEIDSLGIVPATRLAALRALTGLPVIPQYLLTDFRLELPELDISQTALVRGDAICLSIAAASILAKTARDQLMCELDLCYRGYELGKHKGYGTQAHRSAMERLGASPIHRKSFQVKELQMG